MSKARNGIDLADDTPSHQLGRTLLDRSDEFVTGNTAKWVVAASELDVGVADPGGENKHQSLALVLGNGQVIAQPQLPILEPECAHTSRL